MPLLGARPLVAVADVNHFRPVTEIETFAGDAFDLYLQLLDRSQATTREGYSPPGLRYIPATGATLTVTFRNLDSTQEFTRSATQPFPGDLSIWKVAVLTGDPLSGTVNLLLTLTEGGATRKFILEAGLQVGDSTGTC